jgi:hypothetical protein
MKHQFEGIMKRKKTPGVAEIAINTGSEKKINRSRRRHRGARSPNKGFKSSSRLICHIYPICNQLQESRSHIQRMRLGTPLSGDHFEGPYDVIRDEPTKA